MVRKCKFDLEIIKLYHEMKFFVFLVKKMLMERFKFKIFVFRILHVFL